MTTKEKQQVVEVSEQTRTFARWWIHRLEQVVKAHGLPFRSRTGVESPLGEVRFEWVGSHDKRKKLSLYIEDGMVTYFRLWDWDDRGRGGYMEEGECTWLDTGLLLWQWFLS